jgi:hypothetical protein
MHSLPSRPGRRPFASTLSAAGLLCLWLPPSLPAQSMFDGLKEKAAAAAAKAGEVAGEVTDKAGAAAGNAVRAAGELGDQAVDNVKTTVTETSEDLGDADTPAATRAKLDVMASQTLDRLLAQRPDVAPLVGASDGYAVFDTRQVKLGLAGGYGRGVAVNNDTGERTYMRMASAGVGVRLGFGGFDTQFVILFETPFAFQKFVTQGLDATAEASTMTGDKHDRMALGFEDGRAVFVLTKQGWKVAAGLTGSRYWPDQALNASDF